MGQRKSRVPAPPASAVEPTKSNSAPPDPRRKRTILIGIAAALAAPAVGIAFGLGRGGEKESSGTLGACTLETFPAQGMKSATQRARHVTELPTGFEYNSFPPSSGPHHPQWVIWNRYDRRVSQLKLVHNLEHGGIVVQYGSGVPDETVDQIAAWYSEDPNAIVVTPLPSLQRRIALTAWTAEFAGDPTSPGSRITHSEGRVATCPTFDEEAFSEFRDDYRYEGVERFPPEQLQPGM